MVRGLAAAGSQGIELQFGGIADARVSVGVFDVSGREIASGTFKTSGTGVQESRTLMFRRPASGMYCAVVNRGEATLARQFMFLN